MKSNNNFELINKEADALWKSATSRVEKESYDSIKKAKADMSASQKEAAKVQRNAIAKLFDDEEATLQSSKIGGIKNPALSKLGNDLIWGIYHASALVENAKTRTEKNKADVSLNSLQGALQELYSVIDIGKDTDETFIKEYFGLEEQPSPGQPNGMALVGLETPLWSKTMIIRNGFGGEDAKEEYYISKEGDIRLKYSGGILGDQIVDRAALIWLAYDPGLIIDLNSINISMLQSPSTLDAEGNQVSILDNSLQYNDAYLMLDSAFVELSKDGKTQTEFIPANMAKIANDTKSRSGGKAAGLLNEYEEANRAWRNNFNMEEDLKFVASANGINIDIDQQVEFKKLMFDSIKPLLPSVATGITTEVVKEEVKPEMVEEEVIDETFAV